MRKKNIYETPLNSVPHILLPETDFRHSYYAFPYLLTIFTAVHMTITFLLLKHCYQDAQRERERERERLKREGAHD